MTTAYLTRFRNAEYLQYMNDVLELVNKEDVTALLLTTQRDDLSNAVSSINNSFQQTLGSALTQDVIDLDNRRDRAFMGLKAMITSFTYHFDATTKAFAETALATINNYGKDVTRKSYQEETAILTSLIHDFETEQDLIDASTALSLTDWLTELKDANVAFAAKYLERVGDTAANPITNLTDLRAVATTAYKSLVDHIQAHAVLGTDATYATLVDEIDVLTKQYNLVVDNRTGNTTTPVDDDIVESL